MEAAEPAPARHVLAVLALAALVFGLGFANRTTHLFEWDSANYALGALDFDVARHQPHPPGYPLWIALLKIARLVTDDANLSQELYGNLFTLAGLLQYSSLASRLSSSRRAFLSTLVLATAPMVVLYARVASTYPVDLFMTAYSGRAGLDLFQRRRRPTAIDGLVFAAFLGLRQSGALLLLPLWTLCAVRASQGAPLALAKAAGAAVLGTLAWFLPTAWQQGGLGRYLAISRENIAAYIDTSVFFGATTTAHTQMIEDMARYAGISLAGVAAACSIAALLRMLLRGSEGPRTTPADSLALFFGAWLLPNLAYVFGVHSVKPGYFMLSLPPTVLLGSLLVERIGAPLRDRARDIAFASGVLVNLAVPRAAEALGAGEPFGHHNAWLRGVPSVAAAADSSIREYDVVTRSLGVAPERILTVVLSNEYEGANWRVLMTEFPNASIVRPDVGTLQLLRHREGAPFPGLQANVDFLVWLTPTTFDLPAALRGLPRPALVLHEPLQSIWLTALGPRPFEGVLTFGGRTYRIAR